MQRTPLRTVFPMPTSSLSDRATAPAPATGERAWPPLELYDVRKRWRKDTPLIESINLTIEPGESVWIGGRNGAGKTTLLRIAAGLIDPSSGEVRAFGLHPFRDRRGFQRRVGFLSAGNAGVYARLTVRGQMDIWARIAYVPREQRGPWIETVMQHFVLASLAGQRSDRLSMGQRQRLRLAMTFVAQPDLVLLDEPRNSLDAEGHEMLKAAIRGTTLRGGAVLWVSPTGEPSGFDFDSRYILEQGQLRAE
jgi:ABC-type multidrug transport system ATPase subunit